MFAAFFQGAAPDQMDRILKGDFATPRPLATIRVVNWNIERCLHFDPIAQSLPQRQSRGSRSTGRASASELCGGFIPGIEPGQRRQGRPSRPDNPYPSADSQRLSFSPVISTPSTTAGSFSRRSRARATGTLSATAHRAHIVSSATSIGSWFTARRESKTRRWGPKMKDRISSSCSPRSS